MEGGLSKPNWKHWLVIVFYLLRIPHPAPSRLHLGETSGRALGRALTHIQTPTMEPMKWAVLPISKNFSIQTRGAVLSCPTILKFLPARFKTYYTFWQEPTGFKKFKNWKLFKMIKLWNQLPLQTNSGPKFWNSSIDHRPLPTLSIQQPRYHLCPLLGWVLQVQVWRSGLTALYWIVCQSRTRTLCTNFLLADSSTLDWHPILNAAPVQAEKLLRIRKDWTANPPAQPDNQGVNSMLPNDDCTYRIRGELFLGCWKQTICQ